MGMLGKRTMGLAAAIVLLAAPGANACGPEIEVQFIEADGDVFIVTNLSEEPWALISLTIRLSGSRGHLVFDTEDGGPGYSMHQPFEAVANDVGLLGQPVVVDGAEELRLRFADFGPGKSFMFGIDVDDRLEVSDFGQAVVSGAEIEGAGANAVLVRPGGTRSKADGRFRPDGKARLRGALCT